MRYPISTERKTWPKKNNSSVTEPQKGEFVISRSFDVPREFMFKLWTDSWGYLRFRPH